MLMVNYQAVKAAVELISIKTSVTTGPTDLQGGSEGAPPFARQVLHTNTASYVYQTIVHANGKHLIVGRYGDSGHAAHHLHPSATRCQFPAQARSLALDALPKEKEFNRDISIWDYINFFFHKNELSHIIYRKIYVLQKIVQRKKKLSSHLNQTCLSCVTAHTAQVPTETWQILRLSPGHITCIHVSPCRLSRVKPILTRAPPSIKVAHTKPVGPTLI